MGLLETLDADQNTQMTPAHAFLISLLYMISVDGQIDSEEIGHLLSIIGGTKERGQFSVQAAKSAALDRALAYRSKNSLDTFLREIVLVLSEEQKRFILLNLVDSALSDGQLEPQEKVMLNEFLVAFGIDWNDFKPYFEVLVLKNDRSILFKPEPQEHIS